MMFRCCVVCAWIALVAACEQVQEPIEPASAMPDPVSALLGELTGLCSEVGGTPHPEQAIRRADLNDDGHDDYILFAGWFDCENAVSIFGDRAMILVVFVADGRGDAREAFRDLVFDAMIEDENGATRLWLTTMAEQCGRPAAETFSEETFCRRAIVPVTMAKFEYAPVSTVRIIE